jgi:hypothetical protein
MRACRILTFFVGLALNTGTGQAQTDAEIQEIPAMRRLGPTDVPQIRRLL